MKPDVFFNNISLSSLGWLRESVNFPTPQSQTETLVVPGRNSPIRFTEALGRLAFQSRSFEITLTMLGDRSDFDTMVSEVTNRFAGKLVEVILTESTDVYAVGTLEAAPSYDPLTGKGTIVFSSSDADAYLYHTLETTVTVTTSGTVNLINDYMPVVPRVKTTAETSLSWKIGTDVFRKTLSAGTWEIPELELGYGSNTISITGSGTTTFTYREGRL